MPWKHNGRIIKEGKAWIADDNTKHPGGWLKWTAERKKAMGLVWENPPASGEPFDNRFYNGRTSDGKLLEKSLEDEKVMDKTWDESKKEWVVTGPLLDDNGNQVINEGLRTIWINKTKETANNLLSFTDWMITRKAEKGTAIPDETTKYRDSVRTACNTIETKINNCTKLSELVALFNAPVDSDGNPKDGNPPIFDFPKES